jgi:hypothetical protein
MRAYHEYLELFSYFALPGEKRLTSVEFQSADEEWKELAARHKSLDEKEKGRFAELKALLHREKP